ncbi:MAG: NADH-quinone oxidoreductase subunit L [Sandaracinus sp.]
MEEYFSFSGFAQHSLVWIVLLPLLAAVINGSFGGRANKSLVTGLSVGSVFTSFLIALYAFVTLLRASSGEGGEEDEGRIVQTVYEWFDIALPAGQGAVWNVPIHVRFVMDHLSGIMTVMVTGIASLIHVYSTSYMGEDPGYPRFMTYLNLFTASMLILVLGSNVPLMFVGWEGVGLCSYLLIGYWWENPAYAAAGRKAFVVNRIGDFGVLIGTFLLVSVAHSFEFDQINAASAEIAASPFIMGGVPWGVGIGTLAALLLFLGCTGKSAQLPLYVWLPDAMAGPTPVSALIHAATMVTAGVYLCCRLSNVFLHSTTAMAVIALVGTATAFVAASIGLVQNQMKKILAYSTVSQLGFMFAAVGTGAFGAGIFHVFTHAFFKACLFLGAGSVMHAVHAHGDADIRYLGGMRKYMPRTAATFLIACLAIAGFPLTSGFFSKDDILYGALESTEHLPAWVGWTVFVGLSITAAMTAFYMFRLYFRTFEGKFKGGHEPAADAHGDDHGDHDDHGHAEPHESDDAITIPLIVLALGALVVGFLGLPHWFPVVGEYSWWGHWMSGAEGHWGPVATWARLPGAEVAEHAPMWMGWTAMGVGTLAGLGGIGLAYSWYYAGDGSVPAGMAKSMPGLHSFLMDKWRVDELYELVLIGPFRSLAVVAANIDRLLVDGLLTVVPGLIARGLGLIATRLQTGAIYMYTTIFAIGAAGMLWWFTYPHTTVVGQADGATVEWEAERGTGYRYRWDFDSDGEVDTEWSTSPAASHTYGGDDAYVALVAQIEGSDGTTVSEVEIGPGAQRVPLDDAGFRIEDLRGEGEEPPAHVDPTVRLETEDGTHVVLDTGTAQAMVGAAQSSAETHEFDMDPGDVARMSGATLRIVTRACATVETESPFGNRSHTRECITIRVPHMEMAMTSTGGAR